MKKQVMAPITKWSAVCMQADRMPDLVATAFRHALAQPRGPVYLEVPMDVLFDEVPAPDEIQPISPSRVRICRQSSESAATRPSNSSTRVPVGMTRVVQAFIREPAGERAVADDGDDLVVVVVQIATGRDTECGRD